MNSEEINGNLETESMAAVFAAPDEVTAQMVRGFLEAEGIPAVIGKQVTYAYAPNLQIGEGFWGEVCVPISLETQARSLLEAFEEGQGRVSDEELAEAAAQSSDPGV